MRLLSKIKSLFSRASTRPTKHLVRATPIEHPVLGSLVPHDTFADSLSGQIKCGVRQVDLLVSPDDKTIEAALKLAVGIVAPLQQLDFKCKNIIADEFLDSYNSGWRFGQVAQQDGTFSSFEKPLLTREQFRENLKLNSIEASGELMLIFWYGDNDMFWGHSLEVTSFDGPAFKDTHASMAG